MQKSNLNFFENFKAIILLAVFFLIVSQFFTKVYAAYGINRQINFQGKLVNNPSSTNVTDTSYSVVFTIYDKASGGTALWTENQTITTSNGIFQVALGSVTPFPTSFNFNWSGLYLGMKVSPDSSEMSPRIQLAAVPFAFNAQQVAGLTVQDSTSGAASTSATLKIGDATTPKTFDLGANNLTFTTSGTTSLILPTSGTVTALGNSTTGTGTTLVLSSNPSFAGITLSSGGISLGGNTSDSSHCIVGGATAAWGSCGTGGGGNSPFAEITGANGGLIVPNNSTEDLLLGGQSTTSATFHFYGLAQGGTRPVASISAKTSFSGLVVDQSGVGDIFTASASGLPIFTIQKNGYLSLNGYNTSINSTGTNTLTLDTGSGNGNLYIGNTNAGSVTLGRAGATSSLNGSTLTLSAGSGGLALNSTGNITSNATTVNFSSAALTVSSCSGCGQNYWNLVNGNGVSNGGYLTPINSTADFLIGGQSTASADFAITGLSGSNPSLTFNGAATIGSSSTGDDVIKQTTSAFTQAGYSITQSNSANTVSTSNNQLALNTDIIGAGGTLSAPAPGPSTGTNVGVSMPSANSATTSAIQRPDSTFLVVIGGSSATTKIYDPVQNVFTAGPNLSANAGNGLQMIQRADGSVLIIHGAATTTTIYYPWTTAGGGGQTKAGPAFAAGYSPGAGSQVIRMSDGRFLIIIGGGNKGTEIYDPVVGTTDLGSFNIGPQLTSTVGPGSFVFQRPDGKWIVGLGCQNTGCSSSSTTNIFDPSTLTFSAGQSLTAGSGLGAHAIQRPDGKFLVILGGGTTTTNTYDPGANTFTNSGAVTTANVGQGGFSFQRSDGKWITVLGGNSAVVNLYNPSTDSFSNPATNLQGNAGPGALAFQRPDGMYVVVGGNATQTTTLFDAGWNTTGTWTSEDINSTKISTYSAMFWSDNTQSLNNTTRLDKSVVEFFVKTADTENNLGLYPYIALQNSGDLINAVAGAAWVKIQVVFNAPVRAYPQSTTSSINQTNIWGGEGSTYLRRTFITPAVFQIKVQNPLISYGGIGQGIDPQFGRNFATAGATLEGVITNNDNQLTLAVNRNIPTATQSAGYIIASSSANLGGSAGSGANTLQLPNGQYLVILGGASTATRMYNPDTHTFSAGPTLPNAASFGSHAFELPNGNFMVILGNSSLKTAIYTPPNSVFPQGNFIAGPNLVAGGGSVVGNGATSFQRPDGLFVVLFGNGSNVTNIYDPFLNQFTQGPYLNGNLSNGSAAIVRPDGRILVFIGNATPTTSIYDFPTNSFNPGPILPAALNSGSTVTQLQNGKLFVVAGNSVRAFMFSPITNEATLSAQFVNLQTSPVQGSFVIPRPDGKILIATGNGTNTSTVFDPDTNTAATAANSPTMPCTIATTGAHVFQRASGEYVVICGNGANTGVIDAGWNLGGTYTTEQIYVPNLSSSTSLFWQNLGQGQITVKYRTASSKVALGLASWINIGDSGNLINPSAGDVWFQARFDFEGALPTMLGAEQNVWSGEDNSAVVVYYRSVQAPIMSYWKLSNTSTPNILTLTSGGSNAFRFTADGQAFTSDGGAWNSGGADLAERYTSTQTLQDGEVVVGDRLNAQNVIRSTTAYQSNIMGVVSTQPGFVAGSYTPDSYPIALVGRVPVKVSTENGPIHSGDYLTSASIPGYAMKATVAGRVLGTALQDFDPTDPNQTQLCPSVGAGNLTTTQCGTITAFINLTSYNGENVELAMADAGFTASPDAGLSDINANTGLTSYTQLLSAGDKQTLAYLEYLKTQGSSAVLNSEIFTGKVSAANEIITPSLVADIITAKTIRADHIEGLEIFTNQLSALQSQISTLSASISTDSAVLGDSTSGFLNLTALNIQGSATVSADLNVGGNGVFNGILTVFKSITTPNLLVSDFASFLNDVVFKGNVRFSKSPTFGSDTAGFAVIKKGQTSVEIDFDNEFLNTPVITASIVLNKTEDASAEATLENSILSGNVSYVITQRTTKGFVIKLSKPADQDINFSWVSLAIDNAKTSGIGIPTPTINPNATQSAAFQSVLNQLNN